MDLETYLKAIESCPDGFVRSADEGRGMIHELTAKFGIYDNFEILMKVDYRRILDFFENHEDYVIAKKVESKREPRFQFFYRAGTVLGNVKERVIGTGDIKSGKGFPPERRQFYLKAREFKIGITLHPYQGPEGMGGKFFEGLEPERVIQRVISDIGRWAIKENHPLHIPHVGWNLGLGIENPQRYREMIYFATPSPFNL